MSTTELDTYSELILGTQSEQVMNLHLTYIVDLGKSLNFYGTPFITALGLFGNICTFLIMSRPGFNKSSTSIHFRWLAIVDFDLLMVNQLFIWIDDKFDARYHFWLTNDILCKLNYANVGWSMTTSATLLVAVERFLITAIHLKSKIYCTVRHCRLAWGDVDYFTYSVESDMGFLSIFKKLDIYGQLQQVDYYRIVHIHCLGHNLHPQFFHGV